MKKILLITFVAIMAAFGMKAEQGDVSIGAQFAYASRGAMAGLGAQLQYEAITNWRFAPEFIYYLKNDDKTAINANLNIHYIIPTGSTFAIYPLAGFTFARFTYDGGVDKQSFNRCGANIGLGAQYRIQDRLHFFTEERFQILKDHNQSVTVLGLKYTF